MIAKVVEIIFRFLKLSEPGRQIQIYFIGNLHNNNLHSEVKILIAVDRLRRWPTVKICKMFGNNRGDNFPIE